MRDIRPARVLVVAALLACVGTSKVSASDVPSPFARLEIGSANIGLTLPITVVGSPNSPLLLAASPTAGRRLTRFGEWCLAPSRTIILGDGIRASGPRLDASGHYDTSIAVPARAGLLHHHVYFQAAVRDDRAPSGITLTRTEARIIGNGSRGDFSREWTTLLPNEINPFLATSIDVDGDADLDVLIWDGNGGLFRLLINDGHGIFGDGTIGTTTGLPTVNPPPGFQIAALDADGDGDLDVAYTSAGYVGGVLQRRIGLLLNDGQGMFTNGSDGSTYGTPPAQQCCTWTNLFVADFDGDGSPDLLAFGYNCHLLLNDGLGRFRDATNGPGTGWAFDHTVPGGSCGVIGDLDGDGDVDILSIIGPYTHLHVNDGHGFFTEGTNGPGTSLPPSPDLYSSFTYIVSGDIDDDGDLDLVLTTDYGQTRTWINQGGGAFVDETWGTAQDRRSRVPLIATFANVCALVDVDRDGDLDIVQPSIFDATNLLFLNDGTGHFSSADPRYGTAPPVRTTLDGPVLLGVDLDNDGDPDLIATQMDPNGSTHVEIHWNR